MLKEDRNLLAITHYTQLINYVSGFGGFIVPLVLWLTQKDKIIDMDEHGKAIVNFQLSMFIYAIASALLIILGIGILGLIAIAILEIAFPIINGLKASKGEPIDYPFSIKFIK
jgi:uncharacterized Tic20 family protein